MTSVFINSTVHELEALALINEGGEAHIYALNSADLAKIYKQAERAADARKHKVLALCEAYWRHISEFGDQSFAFPKFPAYLGGQAFENISGFSMRHFPDCPEIGELEYDLEAQCFPANTMTGGPWFDDTNAIQYVYDIFVLLEHLHKGRIILGDTNPGNVLYNPKTKRPVIIDLDSAQIELHPATAMTPDLLDPLIKRHAKASGNRYYFGTHSDIFGVAWICYRFLVGVPPFFLYSDPPQRDDIKKLNGICLIRCFFEGKNSIDPFGSKYVDNPQNEAIIGRLTRLQQIDKNVITFFYNVFVHGRRDSLLSTLPKNDSRHPSHIFFVPPGVRDAITKWKSQGANAAPAAMPPRPAFASIQVAAPEIPSTRAPEIDPPELVEYLNLFGISRAEVLL